MYEGCSGETIQGFLWTKL